MKRFITIVNGKIGSVLCGEDLREIIEAYGQKRTSQLLSEHGWKKDYHFPCRWVRVCVWPYLSYYEGKKMTTIYMKRQIRKHLKEDVTTVRQNEVNIFAGCRMNNNQKNKVMLELGFEYDGEFWTKKDKENESQQTN